MSFKWASLRAIVGSVAISVLIASCGLKGSDQKKMPDFTLPVYSPEGQSINLHEVNSENPVLLTFWASWCPSCVEEIPTLKEWQKKYGPKGLKVLGVNVQESPEEVGKFLRSHKINYPVLLDKEGDVSNRYGLVGLPVSILMAKGGEVVYYGFSLPPDIEKFLEQRRV